MKRQEKSKAFALPEPPFGVVYDPWLFGACASPTLKDRVPPETRTAASASLKVRDVSYSFIIGFPDGVTFFRRLVMHFATYVASIFGLIHSIAAKGAFSANRNRVTVKNAAYARKEPVPAYGGRYVSRWQLVFFPWAVLCAGNES
ncbi:MAG TPA: hypothetical protein VEZ24_19555 [Microvirga sp.]|nr:hypothetical protein [Microvirga sp.]